MQGEEKEEKAAARITTKSVAMDGSFMVCEMKYGGVLFFIIFVFVSHQISHISCMKPNPALREEPTRQKSASLVTYY